MPPARPRRDTLRTTGAGSEGNSRATSPKHTGKASWTPADGTTPPSAASQEMSLAGPPSSDVGKQKSSEGTSMLASAVSSDNPPSSGWTARTPASASLGHGPKAAVQKTPEESPATPTASDHVRVREAPPALGTLQTPP